MSLYNFKKSIFRKIDFYHYLSFFRPCQLLSETFLVSFIFFEIQYLFVKIKMNHFVTIRTIASSRILTIILNI